MTLLMVEKYLHRAPFSLEGMALEMPELAEPHPNRVPFSGILTRIDEPSTRPPNGSDGHRVLIPRPVAEAAIPSLLGMPVDCSLNLRDHNKRVVVGVITGASIEANDLVVHGHLLSKNFPGEVAEIQSKKSQLGMSYEISNVEVEDVNAPIWVLTGLQFTGAAILLKSAAAYQHTAIAARADEEDDMAGAVEMFEKLDKKLDGINGKLRSIEAAQQDEDDEAASKDEAEATRQTEAAERYEAAAIQARKDEDDEDATREEQAARSARLAASAARVAAAKRHEDAAARLRAAAEKETEADAKTAAETAAKRHDEEARRLHAAEDKAQGDAEDAKAELDALGTQHVDKQHALWEKMCAMMLRAAMEDQSAAKDMKKKGTDEDDMMRVLVKAMSFMPGMMDAAKEHPDEEQDKQLIRELLRKGKDRQQATAMPLEANRRLRRLEAAMELLTDQVAKAVGLLTDQVHAQRNLATDGHQGVNGGVAQRKTMSGAQERWEGKFDQVDDGKKQGRMTREELSAALDAAGIRDPAERIARQITYERGGGLV